MHFHFTTKLAYYEEPSRPPRNESEARGRHFTKVLNCTYSGYRLIIQMMLVIVDIWKTFYYTLLIIKSKTSIFSQTTVKEDCEFKIAIVPSATETREAISKK